MGLSKGLGTVSGTVPIMALMVVFTLPSYHHCCLLQLLAVFIIGKIQHCLSVLLLSSVPDAGDQR